jgi:hypothetical protein
MWLKSTLLPLIVLLTTSMVVNIYYQKTIWKRLLVPDTFREQVNVSPSSVFSRESSEGNATLIVAKQRILTPITMISSPETQRGRQHGHSESDAQRSKLYGHVAADISGYVHLEYVALSSTSIHVFAPSLEMRQAISASGIKLPRYKRFFLDREVFDLPTPKWVLHDEQMDVRKHCSLGFRDEIAFFSSAWHTDNMFHLMNDNILPLVYSLMRAPWCNATTLKCAHPTTLYQLAADPKRLQKEGIFGRTRSEGYHIFDGTSPADKVLGTNQNTCFRALTWGRGPVPFYRKGARFWSVSQGIASVLNAKLRAHFHLPPRNGGKRKVIHIKRSPPRYIIDAGPLMAACQKAWLQCEECCNWMSDKQAEVLRRVGDADVIMGRHGAGLAHVLFAAPGATLIDFGARPNWRHTFNSMAKANANGSYVRVSLPDMRGEAATITEVFADTVFSAVQKGVSTPLVEIL